MPVVTVEGEDALRRLNALAAFYASSIQVHATDSPGRLSSGRRASSARRTLQETVIVRCVTVIEAYLTDLATRLVSDRLDALPAGNRAQETLVEHLRDSRLGGLDQGRWEDLITLWSRGLGVAIKQDYGGYSKLLGLRVTRHAIAHRYGEITEQYRKHHRQRLAKEGFRDPLLAKGPVPISETDVLDGLTLALTTVRWLERALAVP